MSHLDSDRLTAWAHDLPGAGEAEAHLHECPECRAQGEAIRREARALTAALADPARLAAVQARLLERAAAAPPRARTGLLWQIPAAAAILFALVVTLALPAPATVELVDGRVEAGGREVAAPAVLSAGEVRALEPSTLRMASRSTAVLEPSARIGLAPGAGAHLRSGRVRFTVARGAEPVVLRSGAGMLRSPEGEFNVHVIARSEGGTQMKGMLTGVVVTVLAGSVGLSNAEGAVEAEPGQVAVLAPSQAPLFVAQDDPETLLRRLEELAAAIARLEAEISKLEARNAQLKTRLKNGVYGGKGKYYFGGTSAGGANFKVLTTDDDGVQVEAVIIEKNAPSKKKEK